jgi:hypothetical protein
MSKLAMLFLQQPKVLISFKLVNSCGITRSYPHATEYLQFLEGLDLVMTRQTELLVKMTL